MLTVCYSKILPNQGKLLNVLYEVIKKIIRYLFFFFNSTLRMVQLTREGCFETMNI